MFACAQYGLRQSPEISTVLQHTGVSPHRKQAAFIRHNSIKLDSGHSIQTVMSLLYLLTLQQLKRLQLIAPFPQNHGFVHEHLA